MANKKYPYYDVPYIEDFNELLNLHIKGTPNKTAFSYRCDDKIINKTFQDVHDEAYALARYLKKKFKDEHIAIIGPNSYEWIVLFLAIVISENTAVIIDKDYDEEKIKMLLNQSDTKIAFYASSYVKIDNIKCDKYEIENFDQYIFEGKKIKLELKSDKDKGSIIFFTSGTTGPNKGVVLSQKSISTDIYGAASLFVPGGTSVSFLPYHHSFGLITSALKPFYYAVPTLINDSLKHVASDLKEYKPETIFAVPVFVETFYKQVLRGVRKKKLEKKFNFGRKLSNMLLKVGIDKRKTLFKEITDEFGGQLHYIICGGAYLDPKYVKFFRSIGIEILNGYGITEASPVVSVNRNHHQKDGSVGQICRGVDIKIIDDEICIKGPNILKEYYKDEEGTSSVLIDGYFHTGDLGYVDKDGFVFITGRKKNIIILSNGENVSPETIEEALLGDAAVEEVVVYEEDDKLVAFIYPSEDYIDNEEYFNNLIYEYNKKEPRNRQISRVRLRKTEFVKNNNRKILRNKIEEE